VLVAICSSATPLLAQQYPSRPLRLVIPFPPGGSADTVGRVLGQKLSESLGQQVIIDNRPGASTLIGSEIVAKAAPDGHTVLLGSAGLTINVSLMDKLNFDPINDLAPVTLVTSAPNILVVNPAIAANSVQELIALARSRPRQLNFGSAGQGTGNHLAGEMFKVMAGVEITHVPYKGDAPAVTELIGGQIQMLFVGMAPVVGHIKSGRLRALAVTGRNRSTLFPDLQTMIEAGLPGYESNTWAGLMVPKGTPQALIARLNQATTNALNQPDVREKLNSLLFEPVGNSPEEFGRYIVNEVAKWARVIQQAKLRLE
jgi:tripartite-type tricarboxylate transporter receptor subunit TctC